VARHVLLGAFNRRSEPVGFHHAPGGVAPPGRRIDEVLERYPDGTYRARVSFYDPKRGWVRKQAETTMFPDTWTSEEVLAAGREAFRRRVDKWHGQWRGHARGLRIDGYGIRSRRGPTTFYPGRGGREGRRER
jgi:hypothetical protein